MKTRTKVLIGLTSVLALGTTMCVVYSKVKKAVLEAYLEGGVVPTPTIKPSEINVSECIFEDLNNATNALNKLMDLADKYEIVSVADYHDLIMVSSNFIDNAYGWKRDSIITSRIVPVRGGYIIELPNVELL